MPPQMTNNFKADDKHIYSRKRNFIIRYLKGYIQKFILKKIT